MNTDSLNKWLTLLANLGVLAGMVLLLVELNQNQAIARAEIRNEIYLGLSDALSILDRDTAEALVKTNAGEDLDPVETALASRWAETLFRYWENANYQYEMGMYDETEYSAQRNVIRVAILDLYPAVLVPHFCNFREGFSEHFNTMVSQFISREMCTRYSRYKL